MGRLRGLLYRMVMRIAHRYDWHYAPKIGPLLPGGEYQLWCKWCGFRETLRPMRAVQATSNVTSGNKEDGR